MNRYRRLLVSTLALAFLALPYTGWSMDRFVSLSGGGIAPYTNWSTAARTIQAAVDAAVTGDVVWVTNGVYNTGGAVATTVGGITNRVMVSKAITVQSVNGPELTTIVGQGTNGDFGIRCVYLVAGAQVSGFTLTNGSTRIAGTTLYELYGGGALLDTGGLLSNCVIRGNTCVGSGAGGGVCIQVAGVVSRCVIEGNIASRGAGLRFQLAPTGKLENSIIRGNTADVEGGGVQIYHEGSVNNCLIASNTCAGNGGGVHVDWGSNGSTPRAFLNNCTIVGNTAGQNGGVGYIVNSGAFQNTIIWGNVNGNWSGGAFNYSCTTPLPTGAGNTESDPKFTDPAQGGYDLGAGSSCINAGSNAFVTGGLDLMGRPRIVDDTVDIGAYEVQEFDLVVSALPAPHGVPAPFPYGTNRMLRWTFVTNTVTSPSDQANGIRYLCTGWAGQGSVPAVGTTNSVAFQLAENSLLTWLWAKECWLGLGSLNGGIEGATEGWHPVGFVCNLSPGNASGFVFDHWVLDDTNIGARVPLTLTSDVPHEVEAVYTPIPPAISVTPSSQAFGSLTVGSTADLTFTVQNSGFGTLTGSASVSSPFSIVSSGSYSLGAGSTQVVTVRFSPVSAGLFDQNVSFTGGSNATRAVSGTGVALPTPVISLTPLSRVHTSTAASGQTIGVAANVPWTALASPPWITITGGSSGSGNGAITYSVPANSGAARSGTITVSGGGISRAFTVNQAGPAGNSYLSVNQQCTFTYFESAFFAFICDYSTGNIMESMTPGFVGYDITLLFNAQTPAWMTTHVAYIYNTTVGQYTEAMAILGQNL